MTEASPAGRASTEPGAKRLLTAGVRAVSLALQASTSTLLVYVAAVLAAAGAPVVAAWLTKLILDLLAEPGIDTGGLIALAVTLAVVGAAAAMLPQAQQFLSKELERRVGVLAQDRLFGAVERFSGLARFESPKFLDRLRLASQSADQTSAGVIVGMSEIGGSAVTALGFLGSLAVLSPVMTAAVLGSAIPVLLAELALSRRRARMLWDIGPTQRREFFYSQLLGTVEAAKEIRLFGVGAFLRGRMVQERRTANAATRAVELRQLWVQSGLGLLGAGVAGAGLVWAVLAALAGTLSIGDVSLFLAAIAGVQSALVALVRQIAQTHHALIMFTHYLDVVDADADLPVAAEPRSTPSPLREGIEVRGVWFRYSEEHPWVLRGVDLDIPAGQALALVGRNGAGKSTLVKLLCRFYDPDHGEIRWDGIDLRDLAPEDLRARIGAVFQDYMEYDLVAAENIALGDLSALEDRERIEEAARRAGVHDDLARLPMGYDTLLSRMWSSEHDKGDPRTGVVPSGGQWQRLALARGLLRHQRDLMILDEPSAGLDAEAEHRVHTRLRELRADRTSLLISHRLGAIRDADTIAVLDEGQVVEFGSHDDLLRGEGTYAHLFNLQAEGYRAGTPGEAPGTPREGPEVPPPETPEGAP